MELFAKATEFCGSEPTANAKSMLALSLVKMLFALDNQLAEYRKRIEELFEFIPITTCSVPYLEPDPSLLRAC